MPILLVTVVTLAFAGCSEIEPIPADTDTPSARERAKIPDVGFRGIVDGALPTIVFIQAEATPPPGIEGLFPNHNDDPLPLGVGSGVIFRPDGYILTSNHVVQDAERVLVVMHDRRYLEAEVIGRDQSTDVAVVRVNENDLPTATLGDSDAIELGDFVLAMGSPLGLDFSVTMGIVSGKGRALGIIGSAPEPGSERTPPLEHFIQTDAALSPGNSGGPLMNSSGEVIGINTAVAVQPGMPVSFGFAIPSNLAHSIAEQLIEHGEVSRPYLGVGLRTVTPRLAEQHGLDTVVGAAVAQVEPESPAARAGVRENDVILGINDAQILTVSDLQAHLAGQEPGSTVRLRIFREGRETTVEVELDVVRSGNVEPRTQMMP